MADLTGRMPLPAARDRAWLPPGGAIAAWRTWPAVKRFVAILFVVYLAKQIIFVVAFPPFSGHDEVAHYSYLRTVATEGRLPEVVDLEEYRAALRAGQEPVFDTFPDELYPYCRYTLDWWCEPRNPRWVNSPPHQVTVADQSFPSGMQYAANHPPLYYIIMSPLYWVSDGTTPVTQHYLLRLAAIPFGLVTVYLAFLLARTLFPGDTFLGITVPAFVAFQPQISYEAAMVNNDIVCIMLYSWVLYLVVVGIRDHFPRRICLLTGFALGLALLAKGTSLTAVGIVGLAVIAAVGIRDVRGWFVRGLLVAAPCVALVAPWYLFLYRTYGNFSGLDRIEALQYWNQPEGNFLELLTSRDFIVLRFKETWGEFGWRLIHLDAVLLWLIAASLVIGVIGLVLYLVTTSRWVSLGGVSRPVLWQRRGVWLMVITCLVAYVAVVQFGTRFELTQARYFFPAVNAAALLIMLGWRAMLPQRWLAYGQGLIVAALVLLNLVIFTQYVIPHYLSAG